MSVRAKIRKAKSEKRKKPEVVHPSVVTKASIEKSSIVKKEILEHIRFTFISLVIAFGIIIAFKSSLSDKFTESIFEKFHFTHLFFAAFTPVAIYYLYSGKAVNAFILGVTGSAIGCTVSDSIFPYLGGSLLGFDMTLHICLISDPEFAIPSLLFGALLGFPVSKVFKKVTHLSHFMHSFIVIISALFYMSAFVVEFALSYQLIFVVIVLLVSVVVPCLFTDVALPSLVISNSSFNEILHFHDEHCGHKK